MAALVAVGAVLLLQRGGRGRVSQSWLRASATLTPGVRNPDVTQRTIHSTICITGWTKTIRPPVDYTNRLKLEQLAAWQLPGTPADYQEDHLISLGIGGHPTDTRNLWPEPLPHAEEVDAVACIRKPYEAAMLLTALRLATQLASTEQATLSMA